MRYFLTFENNYRVYWAWTKYRIAAPIGQISRPNHQPDPASLWLVDGGGRIKWQYWSIFCVGSVIIFNSAELMKSRVAGSAEWRRSWLLCVAGPRWPRVMGTSVSPRPSTPPVPAFSPHHTLYRVTATRWDKTRQDNAHILTNNK